MSFYSKLQELFTGFSDMGELERSVTEVAKHNKFPIPRIKSHKGCWGEHCAMDVNDLSDDIVCADPKLVKDVTRKYGARSFEPVIAHEFGHAKYAANGMRQHLTPHAEEAFCDIDAGLYSGHHGISRGVYKDLIAPSPADSDHPIGIERNHLYNRAYDLAKGYVFRDFQPVTLDVTMHDKLESLYEDALDMYN